MATYMFLPVLDDQGNELGPFAYRNHFNTWQNIDPTDLLERLRDSDPDPETKGRYLELLHCGFDLGVEVANSGDGGIVLPQLAQIEASMALDTIMDAYGWEANTRQLGVDVSKYGHQEGRSCGYGKRVSDRMEQISAHYLEVESFLQEESLADA